jgi:hypothetical protein
MSIKLAGHAAIAATLCGLAFGTPTAARADVAAGSLSCRGGGAVGMVVTSVHHFDCIFSPASGAPPHHYEARIRKVGLDLGFTHAEAIGWLVFAATPRVGPGDLAGSYGGLQAGATVGIGLGGNGLVGGVGNSFALQPVSVQGQTGLSVAGGLEGLELRYVPDRYIPTHRRHHHRY